MTSCGPAHRFPTAIITCLLLMVQCLAVQAQDPSGTAARRTRVSAEARQQGQEQESMTNAEKDRFISVLSTTGPSENIRPDNQDNASPVERFFRGTVEKVMIDGLLQFGYDIFRPLALSGNTGNPLRAEDSAVSVPPDYTLGPGDELLVDLWGRAKGSHTLALDREGKVHFPEIGVFFLGGMKFAEARTVIETEISRFYKKEEVRFNISLGRLHTLRVYVVGCAEKPGHHLLPAGSTVLEALVTAGGPAKNGSLRSISINRGNETTEVDLYPFLLKGAALPGLTLRQGDTVCIAPLGEQVAVAGHVIRPAIYEIKGKTLLFDALGMAGGMSPSASSGRIQLERVSGGKEKEVKDFSYEELKTSGLAAQNGDILRVLPIEDVVKNGVELLGALRRPGLYQWKEGGRMLDYVSGPEELAPNALLDSAFVERLSPVSLCRELISFSPRELFSGGPNGRHNVEVRPGDSVRFLSSLDVKKRRFVSISGAVEKPADYDFTEGMKLLDLVRLGGELLPEADPRSAELTRQVPTEKGPRFERQEVDLGRLLSGEAGDIALCNSDHLLVRPVKNWKNFAKIVLSGEVKHPGTYSAAHGERLSSVLKRAGGLTEHSYPLGSVYTRESVRLLQQMQLTESIDRLEYAMLAQTSHGAADSDEVAQKQLEQTGLQAIIAKMRGVQARGRICIKLAKPEELEKSPYDIEIEDGDTLFIPTRPAQVSMLGAVYNQTSFLFDRELTVEDYISLAGGLTRTADKKAAYILKVDGTALACAGGGSGRWLGNRSRFGSRLDAGDTIVVPEIIDKGSVMKNIKDVTQILFQIASTTGIVIQAMK